MTDRLLLWCIVWMLFPISRGLAQMEVDPQEARNFPFLSVLHRFPEVEELVVEFTILPKTKEYWLFRYSTNGFLARSSTNIDTIQIDASPKDDRACGRWMNEYWALDRNAGSKGNNVRHQYLIDPAFPTNSTAFVKNRGSMHKLTFFGSYGLCDGEIVTAKFNSRNFSFDYEGNNSSGNFNLSNGLPVSATIDTKYNGQMPRESKYTTSYSYDPALAPLPIPATISLSQVMHGQASELIRFRVIRMNLVRPGKQLTRASFFPDGIFTNATMLDVVYTNGQNYSVRAGIMTPMNVSAKVAQQKLERYRPVPIWKTARFQIIAISVGAAIFLLCFAARTKSRVKD
jgi:hypothetical protein